MTVNCVTYLTQRGGNLFSMNIAAFWANSPQGAFFGFGVVQGDGAAAAAQAWSRLSNAPTHAVSCVRSCMVAGIGGQQPTSYNISAK
jgi:hypothetical protein